MMDRREFTKGVTTVLAMVGIGSVAQAEPVSSVALDENGQPENHTIWTNYYDEQFRVVDMTDNHLRNCIMFINRKYHDALVTCNPHRLPRLEMFSGIMRREADRRKLSWVMTP